MYIASLQLRPKQIVDLPVGRVAIPPRADYGEMYRWMAENTSPGQWYFGLPPLALPLRLRSPTPFEAMGPGEYSRPEQVAEVVEGLEKKKVSLMIWWPQMYTPGAFGRSADHLQPLRDYLFLHYRKTKSFADGYEVWERVDR